MTANDTMIIRETKMAQLEDDPQGARHLLTNEKRLALVLGKPSLTIPYIASPTESLLALVMAADEANVNIVKTNRFVKLSKHNRFKLGRIYDMIQEFEVITFPGETVKRATLCRTNGWGLNDTQLYLPIAQVDYPNGPFQFWNSPIIMHPGVQLSLEVEINNHNSSRDTYLRIQDITIGGDVRQKVIAW